ncbi:DUF4282 domain-containing protein [Planctomycetota bacterium]
MKDKARGFVTALMDLSFTEFITTRIIKLLYVLEVIACFLFSVGIIVSGIRGDFVAAVVSIILAPIIFVVGVICARVGLEVVIVMFRIAENTSEVVRLQGGTPAEDKLPAAPAEQPSEDPQKNFDERKETDGDKEDEPEKEKAEDDKK